MRVFEINICPDLSTGTLMNNIASELERKNGNICRTASAPKSNISYRKNHYIIGTTLERYLHIILGQLIGSEASFSIIATKKLIKEIIRFKPDVIHLHNIHQYYLNVNLLFRFLNKYNIPIVWTFHDCWSYTGLCHHYLENSCYKWRHGCRKCPYIKNLRHKPLFDLSSYEYKKKKRLFAQLERIYITTPSRWLASEVAKSIFSNKFVYTIPNGIDKEVFRYRESELRKQYNIEDKFIILGVASHWTRNKGLVDFMLLANRLNNNYQIVLIGVEENTFCENRDNVIYISRTNDQEELVKWYSCADVCCSLSTEETFGMVVAEAMACGTPVIVYRSTASPELVEHTHCYICNPHDITGVITSIRHIQEKGRNYYSADCRRKILDCYDRDHIGKKYVMLYEEIINGDI